MKKRCRGYWETVLSAYLLSNSTVVSGAFLTGEDVTLDGVAYLLGYTSIIVLIVGAPAMLLRWLVGWTPDIVEQSVVHSFALGCTMWMIIRDTEVPWDWSVTLGVVGHAVVWCALIWPGMLWLARPPGRPDAEEGR